jgi:hypothetical protein
LQERPRRRASVGVLLAEGSGLIRALPQVAAEPTYSFFVHDDLLTDGLRSAILSVPLLCYRFVRIDQRSAKLGLRSVHAYFSSAWHRPYGRLEGACFEAKAPRRHEAPGVS